jgi:anthranilate phosphoribosyltransferase
MINIKHLMKGHAAQNIPLTFDEGFALGKYALEGCKGDPLAQIQSIALLSALHNKALYGWQKRPGDKKIHGHNLPDSAADQIAGICAAVFEFDVETSHFGFVNPDVKYVMDNCGMGGDLILTANISTLSAFIAATAGIPMCKHGSPANADEGRHGSSDFVSTICGINTYADKDQVETSVEECHFGYTEALDVRYKHIHLQTHEVAKIPHMNDIIGPITNPVNPHKLSRRVLGVNHLIDPIVIAKVYKILNARGITTLDHGLFVRGFTGLTHYEGIDEISICDGGTAVAELIGGDICEYKLTAEDFGIESVDVSDIKPTGTKGEYSKQILYGEVKGKRLDVILTNAAALFYLAGQSQNWREGYRLAKETFHSGLVPSTVSRAQTFLKIKG